MLVADCVPVLLAAADGAAVAAVHVGRQGLVRGVLPAALARLAEHGAAAADLYAAVGPSICGRCYEVPAALREEVAAQVPGTAATTAWGTPALDLPAGVLAQLAAAGVTRVHHLAACAREDERFYSYRRAGQAGDGATGRFAGVVGRRAPSRSDRRTADRRSARGPAPRPRGAALRHAVRRAHPVAGAGLASGGAVRRDPTSCRRMSNEEQRWPEPCAR